MYLENLVFDAVDPQRLGRFWEAVVGGERLTDEPDGLRDAARHRGRAGARPVLPAGAGAAVRAAATAPGPLGRRPPDRGGRAAARAGRTTPRHRSARRALGGARRPGGQSLLRHGGASGVRRHRADRGAPARLRRPGQGRGVLVLADRLDATRPASRPRPCATRRCVARSSSCAPSQAPRGRPRTGCTSTSGSRPEMTPTKSRPASPSAAAASSTRSGASCRGGTTRTRPATSSACCQRGREEQLNGRRSARRRCARSRR